MKGLDTGLASKRGASRQHLVEDNSEAEDVAPMIHLAAARLLGGHVRYGAHDDPGIGLATKRGHHLAPFTRKRLDEFGETEVDDLRVAFFRDHNVGGLEVSMQDAPIVGSGEPLTDLGGQL